MESVEQDLALPTEEVTTLASPVTDPVTTSLNNSSFHVSHHSDSTPKSARDSKKSSLLNITDQIRRLEIEGNKLRAATYSNLGSINGFSNVESSDAQERVQSSDYSNGRAFGDFTIDQRSISDLRTQLDIQRRETERLQQQLLGDAATFGSNYGSSTTSSTPTTTTTSTFGTLSSPSLSTLGGILQNISGSKDVHGGSTNHFIHQHSTHAYNQTKPAFSTITSSEVGQFGRRADYQPPSHLERSLKESQEQVMELRKKLQEMEEMSTQQKKQFRTAVEEMKTKLHDTIMNRDMVLDLRQKEANSQEQLINKLQSSLTQLQDQYRAHEEVLVSTTRKLEQQAQSIHVSDTALSKVRAILMQRHKKKKQEGEGGAVGDYLSYLTSTSEAGQSGTESRGSSDAFLGHALESCLQELDHELSMKSFKISELESNLEDMKCKASEKERALANNYHDMLQKESDESAKKFSLLDQEHERRVTATEANLTHARQQVAALQAQIQDNQVMYQEELRAKLSDINDLKDKVEELTTDGMKSKAAWQEKRQALETTMDTIQKELVEVKSERDELIRNHAAMETRVEDLQSLVTRHESDLEMERDRVQQQRQREEELRSQVMTLELQATNKQGDIERLERMLEVVKQECSSQVLDKVASVEKLERERYLSQINTLSTQLGQATEKAQRALLDGQKSKDEMESLKTQVCDLTDKLERARSQMETALSEKQELHSVLGERRGELDRLRCERERQDLLLEQRAEELADLKVALDSAKIKLEEKEKVLTTFWQQSSNITQLMEVNTKASDNIREERERLSYALSEKSTELEEFKANQEATNRKLKSREKRVRDLEDERLKVTEELAAKSHELDTLQRERDSLLKELKDSRSEVSTLTSGKDSLKKELARTRALRNKELNKLQTKLKESEDQYKLSQKALRSKDMVDHKAVRFADKIQKEMTLKRTEIDILMSKIHKQEDKLETLTKEKTMVERDKESLKKSLAKSLLHTQSLTEELQTTQGQNKQLVQRVAALEDEVEQAALKTSASQAELEKCEQEITTLRLKHQLDLKEVQQHNRSRGSSRSTAASYTNGRGSSRPSSAPITEAEALSTHRSYDSDSGTASTVKNTLQLRDEKHRDYGSVGKELKMLLSEMRELISTGHEDDEDRPRHHGASSRCSTQDLSASDGAHNIRPRWRERELEDRKISPSLSMQDLRSEGSDDEFQPDMERDKSSLASKSFSGLTDLSDFSAYKEWRPRSYSLTRKQQRTTGNIPDFNRSSSQISHGGMSDVSRLSQSLGSPSRQTSHMLGNGSSSLPNTQELCRRLEEKINSLTLMGGNLVKENKEMAHLINLQGKKLVAVKESERAAWGGNR